MNKFFLALIALTSLCVSLVSCGKEDTPQDGTTDGTYTIFYTAIDSQNTACNRMHTHTHTRTHTHTHTHKQYARAQHLLTHIHKVW